MDNTYRDPFEQPHLGESEFYIYVLIRVLLINDAQIRRTLRQVLANSYWWAYKRDELLFGTICQARV